MTTDTTTRRLVWLVLLLVGALIVLPTFGMWGGMMGSGPMMDGVWGDHMWGTGPSAWMFIIGIGMQLLFLALVIGALYLGYQALPGQEESTDPALDELRSAYARGDLSDEEYERRLERLESES
ncbi:putative membrane protein [Halovivax ruber XH-70]|uniref:Putative membrane protein n=1 Tax=Halovivax ruber (strain DSM 18193 / JCM 13892 / XH-70) TaxID=797302 RepID=L0I878_HALRX|nr:SHOCT domain-containing protein [Halovivax ruber]AGB15008.1 putative membrane protein [Halovivax ruber XH-70]